MESSTNRQRAEDDLHSAKNTVDLHLARLRSALASARFYESQSNVKLDAFAEALLPTVYMTPPPHIVRGVAEILNVSKPAVTRAVDRLSELQMLRRKADETDRRSVLIQRTVRGSVFLREIGEIIAAASLQEG
ncbi:MAG: MarR family transcriptional regulator [Rhodospirillales bacterium]